MILRARIVLPVCQPPLENGAVVVAENRLAAVGTWDAVRARYSEPPLDLGNVILLPGFVNAHCHLDYTDMTGLPAPRQFPDWIKSLLALKAASSYTEYAKAWLNGANMLLRSGVTTVADIEAVPELLPDVWSSTPLRVASFLEMTGVKSRRPPAEILGEAAAKIESLDPVRGLAGLSPHALYSTSPALLEESAKLAREKNWRVTMHVAESAEEFEMYARRQGAMFDWLAPQRDMSDCGGGTPLSQVERCRLLGPNFLAVHANYLQPPDIEALARTGSSVAHCPRSHAYFKHQPFLYADLATAGVNLCLGTDSLASVLPASRQKPELDFFAEMRTFSAAHPAVSPTAILEMATRNGARALGWEGHVGELSPDALADLIAIPFEGAMSYAGAAVVNHAGPVAVSMIDGEWALPPVK